MMKNILLSLVIACGLFMACSDDETPNPSYAERDWWSLAYDPDADELEQLIYEIYEESGLRFFYNDTLGSEIRYNNGVPYTHYQTYKMGYNFTTSGVTTSANYRLSYDREVIKDFVDYYFLIVDPVLNTSSFSYKRFFVVDTVFKGKTNAEVLSYWNDIANNTVVVSMTDVTKKHFNTLSAEERRGLMINVLLNQVYDMFGGGASNTEELQDFFDITKNSATWPTTINATNAPYAKGFRIKGATLDFFPDGSILDYENIEKYGALSLGALNGNYQYFVSTNVDFMDYLRLIFTCTDAEIRARYGEHELIMQKYEYLKTLLEKYGLEKFFAYRKKLDEVED
ncbi:MULTISPECIES: hypothetical protein [Butyricimonas]|uniref:hypothetical protein n=1 Tax=Butyricimonas TaxID=574697 RepID=UPI001D08197D|nr:MULTISPECIES: hypothetical protein [Butyricimonas]MCB6973944.1 hypothetical protein [Butyricimonas synergistica]MCG4520713.1 hypothetical protein [Butyricimonas sp. DFI.6.44]